MGFHSPLISLNKALFLGVVPLGSHEITHIGLGAPVFSMTMRHASQPNILSLQLDGWKLAIYLDVPCPGSDRINGDRINGLVISPILINGR